MKDDPIPDLDHVGRYCGGACIKSDGTVSGVAFQLRSQEEYLSVDWLELLDRVSRSNQIVCLRSVLARRLKIGTKGQIAVLNVGEAKSAVRTGSPDAKEIDFRHEPLEDDPAHSGIFGLTEADDLIADLIASRISEFFPAKNG